MYKAHGYANSNIWKGKPQGNECPQTDQTPYREDTDLERIGGNKAQKCVYANTSKEKAKGQSQVWL